MERTKSNVSPRKGEKKNVFAQMLGLWKEDVNWNSYTEKERKVCIWFGLSFCALLVFGQTWIVFPVAASLLASLSKMDGLNMEE